MRKIAENLGRQAFFNGIIKLPQLHRAFVNLTCDISWEAREAGRDAWERGWDKASDEKEKAKIVAEASSDAPICPYCHQKAKLVTGRDIYPVRSGGKLMDYHHKKYWQCKPCEAHVGCHGKTIKAKGMPANAELRGARMAAHKAFDKHWKSGSMSRSLAYQKLSRALGIKKSECHIGMFGVGDCQRVVLIANNGLRK